MSNSYDVVVIGGGPAGAASAALLAADGHEVLVLEREQFPRFSIGESLLPSALPVLEAIGVDLAETDYQFKQGAEFFDEATGQYEFYSFADAMPGGRRHAYNVERAPFDTMVLDAAQRAGARVQQRERVVEIDTDDELPVVISDQGRYRARYVVDATGRKSLLARKARSVVPLGGMGRAACYARFDGVFPEQWETLQPDGNIRVLRVDDGWMWVIPLCGRRLSVGSVVRSERASEDLVHRHVEASPMLRRLTVGTRVAQQGRVGNFAYRNTRSRGPRWVCVGDSAAFLDPVFSSGVALGLSSAEQMVRVLSPALSEDGEGDADLMAPFADHMREAYRAFHAVIHRWYNSAILDNLFFAEHPDPDFRAGLITMLAGDVWRDDNPFQNLMLAAGRDGDVLAQWG